MPEPPFPSSTNNFKLLLLWITLFQDYLSSHTQRLPPALYCTIPNIVCFCSSIYFVILIFSLWPVHILVYSCQVLRTDQKSHVSHAEMVFSEALLPNLLEPEIFDHAGLLGMTTINIRWRPSTTSSYDIHTKENRTRLDFILI